jgi:hypothetical protein
MLPPPLPPLYFYSKTCDVKDLIWYTLDIFFLTAVVRHISQDLSVFYVC